MMMIFLLSNTLCPFVPVMQVNTELGSEIGSQVATGGACFDVF